MGTISGRGTISCSIHYNWWGHSHTYITEGGVIHIHYRGWGHSHILQRVGSFTYITEGGVVHIYIHTVVEEADLHWSGKQLNNSHTHFYFIHSYYSTLQTMLIIFFGKQIYNIIFYDCQHWWIIDYKKNYQKFLDYDHCPSQTQWQLEWDPLCSAYPYKCSLILLNLHLVWLNSMFSPNHFPCSLDKGGHILK